MRDSPGSLQTGTRPNLHLLEPVDVDLPLLVFLWAHEHGGSDQEEVCEGIPVDVQRLQHTAEVGPDLAGSQNRLRALLLSSCLKAKLAALLKGGPPVLL